MNHKPQRPVSWPARERPRAKLLAHGVAALSDAELLAVLFGTGRNRAPPIDTARGLLGQFGSLRGLCSAARRDLVKHPDFGPARYSTLQAALELARRHYCEPLRRGSVLVSPAKTREFLIAQLRDLPYEVFCCLYLDNRHRLIAFEELFRGTIDGASVHPREVLRQALSHNAAAVILAHNHPSGVAEPSQADQLITRRLRDALALLDIRLLDHLVVAGPDAVSLAERGLM
ncbi:MAG: DNA repair protein RadC [Steroidobacteraceae bacterium]|nr:DNA repair protein RadC [Steroidobacteraceae bacterium]MDW8258347.1 DNA repair protein RadC [Gammaproteobacteria bacterium]